MAIDGRGICAHIQRRRYIALLALSGRGDRLKGWSLGPAEGVAECRYGTIPNFIAQKTTEPAS